MPDRIGQQLGNYQLLRLLGDGGFAEVYLGEHIHLGTQAAIKVLYTQLGRSEIEHFRNEARIIAHLEHPHIVRVLEFGVEGTTPYLVMSYAPGGTLRIRHPKGTRIPLATVVPYVQQAASALQFAHDHKLIHRDVKPENLLVGRANEILLSDFGIALIAQSSRYQSTRDMAGTIAYMAPEQINAHPLPASDQYSLGIVVYEWLTGNLPFHGSFTEIAIKHSVVPPPSILESAPMLSPAVEQVIMTTLAKDPKQRFGSVQAFAQALLEAAQLPASTGTLDPTIDARIPVPTIYPESAIQTEARQSSSPETLSTLASPPSQQHRSPFMQPKRLHVALVLILLILILFGSGSFAIYLAVTSRHIIPSNATSTATQLNAQAPNPYGGTLLISDPMSGSASTFSWPTGSSQYGQCTFSNGTYHVSGQCGSFSSLIPAKFAFEIDLFAGQNCGQLQFDYNPTATGPTDVTLFITLCQNGEYDLNSLIDPTGSDRGDRQHGSAQQFIHTAADQPNIIGVVADGNNVSLFINYVNIASIPDTNTGAGNVVLWGQPSINSNNQAQVLYSNARLWSL